MTLLGRPSGRKLPKPDDFLLPLTDCRRLPRSERKDEAKRVHAKIIGTIIFLCQVSRQDPMSLSFRERERDLHPSNSRRLNSCTDGTPDFVPHGFLDCPINPENTDTLFYITKSISTGRDRLWTPFTRFCLRFISVQLWKNFALGKLSKSRSECLLCRYRDAYQIDTTRNCTIFSPAFLFLRNPCVYCRQVGALNDLVIS